MGMHGDFRELNDIWRNSPWRVKLWLALSAFLASASIASISEAVAKWKGFILEGITFYREYFRSPVAHALNELLGLRAPPHFIDYVVLMALIYGALVRGFLFDLKVDRSRFNYYATVILVGALGVTFTYQLINHATAQRGFEINYKLWGVAYVLIIAQTLIPPRAAYKLLTAVYLILPPLLVAIAAAINLGLNK